MTTSESNTVCERCGAELKSEDEYVCEDCYNELRWEEADLNGRSLYECESE